MPATKKKKTDDPVIEEPSYEVIEEGGVTRVVFQDPNEGALSTLHVRVRSQSPLIMNRFPSRVKNDLLRKHMGAPQTKKGQKDPDQLALDACHIIGRRPESFADIAEAQIGIPAVAFKAATVRAATTSKVKMVDARMMFFVKPTYEDDPEQLVLIDGSTPEMRTDPARNATNVVDVRVRPMVREWTAEFDVVFNKNMVSIAQLVSWINLAGTSVGVLEWRPCGRTSTGSYGTFCVERAEAIIQKAPKG